MKLIVGLGNPGPKYVHSRHNVGWWALDLLAHRLCATQNKERFEGQFFGPFFCGTQKVALLKPLTYMNLSGQSVRAAADYYDVDEGDLLVLYDDIDLDPGRLRLRAKGSAGGHNGMKSVIAHMNSQNFARLRIGVGAKPEGTDLANYVLAAPNGLERSKIEGACDFAARCAEKWLTEGASDSLVALVGGYRYEE